MVEAPIKPKREIDLAEGKQWWAFQPLKNRHHVGDERNNPAGMPPRLATLIDQHLLAYKLRTVSSRINLPANHN